VYDFGYYLVIPSAIAISLQLILIDFFGLFKTTLESYISNKYDFIFLWFCVVLSAHFANFLSNCLALLSSLHAWCVNDECPVRMVSVRLIKQGGRVEGSLIGCHPTLPAANIVWLCLHQLSINAVAQASPRPLPCLLATCVNVTLLDCGPPAPPGAHAMHGLAG
jgi:hypothetical protein